VTQNGTKRTVPHCPKKGKGKGLNRKAVIDVGSNSIKLLVAERCEGGALAIVFDDITVSRLGAGLSKGKPFSIQFEAMERNCRVICDYVKRARAYGAEDIMAVGTMALRAADNREDFIRLVREASGLVLQVITGPREAQLVLSAVLSSFPLEEKTAIFDTGGGSTELIFLQRGKITKKISIPLGCLGITAGYYGAGVVGKPCLEAALHEIDSVLKGHGVDEKPDLLIGVGGTVTTMAAVKHRMLLYNPRVIQGSSLTRQEVEDQIALYASLEETERRKIPGLPAERADLILGGACIVMRMMERLAADALKVSDRGIRHGILYELFRHD
jgi:exopolyphosphatase / guanosine-5'-triphosphate,3'-diphosphate pyrophosphatase